MRTRTLFPASALLVAAVTTLAAPAGAAKPTVDQRGTGTWSAASGALDITGTATGAPVAGPTTGWLAALDGSFPAPGACEDAVGRLTTTGAGGDALVLDLAGTVCGLVAPGAHAGFTGSYRVVSYTGSKGKRAPQGRGHADLYAAADGATQWTASGDLR